MGFKHVITAEKKDTPLLDREFKSIIGDTLSDELESITALQRKRLRRQRLMPGTLERFTLLMTAEEVWTFSFFHMLRQGRPALMNGSHCRTVHMNSQDWSPLALFMFGVRFKNTAERVLAERRTWAQLRADRDVTQRHPRAFMDVELFHAASVADGEYASLPYMRRLLASYLNAGMQIPTYLPYISLGSMAEIENELVNTIVQRKNKREEEGRVV